MSINARDNDRIYTTRVDEETAKDTKASRRPQSKDMLRDGV